MYKEYLVIVTKLDEIGNQKVFWFNTESEAKSKIDGFIRKNTNFKIESYKVKIEMVMDDSFNYKKV